MQTFLFSFVCKLVLYPFISGYHIHL